MGMFGFGVEFGFSGIEIWDPFGLLKFRIQVIIGFFILGSGRVLEFGYYAHPPFTVINKV